MLSYLLFCGFLLYLSNWEGVDIQPQLGQENEIIGPDRQKFQVLVGGYSSSAVEFSESEISLEK